MATTIEVSKQNVETFLRSGKQKAFVIPEYQRPYAWGEEQAETLFEDLWDFAATDGGTKHDGSYFLGCLVSYENGNGEQEIIDGQQRITSLFLLFRAICTKLLSSPEDERDIANNFIGKIESAIWETDKLTGKVNYKSVFLTSRVVNNDSNKILRDILETGKITENAKDNYSKNYHCFQELIDRHSMESPLMIYEFIYALLNQAILLPITTDTQDTALTIFSTLNDRGMPLSYADIFKSKIYRSLNDIDKETFIERWKMLEEGAMEANESVQKFFYYNMFYLLALKRNLNSATPNMKKFYMEDNSKCLNDKDLLDKLFLILNIWKVVNCREEINGEAWSKNLRIKQTLDILSSYPNEFWKYPVIIYYICHHKKENFEKKFELFLNKLTAELIANYLINPTVSEVRQEILRLNSAITVSDIPEFQFKKIDLKNLEPLIPKPNKRLTVMIIKTLAYEQQEYLLPEKWEIEHIFPKKWQTNYITEMPDSLIKEKIEHIGNKLPIEKKLNIAASNGYFSKKKEMYSKSCIAITKDMGTSDILDWDLDSIIKRDVRISDLIVELFLRWENDYSMQNSGNLHQD